MMLKFSYKTVLKMELLRFEKEYTVHVYETGPDGKVNLFSLFNYLQDIASEHAVILGFGRDDLMKNNHLWVLSRMYAVIKELPSWEDRVIVKTWSCSTDLIFAMRSYEIRFPDGRLVASASSSWLIIDRTTKKIQRPGEILTQFNSEYQAALSPVRSAEKLPGLSDKAEIASKLRIKVSDLDVNFHTNNVNYLKLVSDTYDLNFVMHHRLCSAEINYLAESMFNDEIIILTEKEEKEDDGFINHSVFRPGDNRELCRIRFKWEERSN
jgi:medium-chain acyl-[acyl-carrier-protein] hydrolase